jgi:transcriptional regulator with PAS, ATPase and Fis domain
LNVIPIHLPPLRERKEDIPDLVEFFINKYNARHNKTHIQGINSDALKIFERYPWPGNVRELENVIERAVVLETEKRIGKTSLPDELLGKLSPDKIQVPELNQTNMDLEKTLDQIEKKMIANALMNSNGMINKAAQKLNLSFRSMRYRIEKHKLKDKPSKND